ncbi:urease accessory protein UreD [Psychromonas sp. KJ10-10]|uniref:urease accessory protein UreD n=1 Tax=Psychromonas sp. KJ10-10 TaxID=3391823 RepID=UPI0039B6E4CC
MNNHAPLSVPTHHVKSRWLAHLNLELSLTDYGTQLTKTQRLGPLSVQKAFYPEGKDCAHIYLLHPPAGIVSGDELRISITNKAGAHSLITTPGGNRFYRAREDLNIGDTKQTQVTTINLEKHAKCENFPLETIVYNGADGFNQVDIHIQENSAYLGWDITCLGLPSSGQAFDKGAYTQLNRVFCKEKLIYHDRILISAENQLLNESAGLDNNSVFATFLAYAPEQLNDKEQRKTLVEDLREKISAVEAQSLLSITDIDGLLVIRYLGSQVAQCKQLFIILWQVLRPIILDKTGLQPRIWHT